MKDVICKNGVRWVMKYARWNIFMVWWKYLWVHDKIDERWWMMNDERWIMKYFMIHDDVEDEWWKLSIRFIEDEWWRLLKMNDSDYW
jgi:hypothetical protein